MALSACWIVKNEAEVLARSIQSVKDAVDDMVVVDTGSTDDTVEIAKSLGARVEYFAWINDFSAARNYAIGLTKHDHVVFLDADEWIEPALTSAEGELFTKLLRADPELDCLTMDILHVDTKEREFERNWTARILVKKPDLRYHHPIHEAYAHVANRGQALRAIEVKSHIIMHSGYVPDRMKDKLARNLELLLLNNETINDSAQLMINNMYITREYMGMGEIDKAAPHLQYLLDRSHLYKSAANLVSTEPILFRIVSDSLAFNGKISRRQMKTGLFDELERLFPNYPGTPLLEAFYQVRFGNGGDALLDKISQISAKVRALEPNPNTVYMNIEGVLYATCSLAAFRRQDAIHTLEYAVAALRRRVVTGSLFYVVMQAMKGQPPQEIAAFLNQIVGTDEKHKLEALMQYTRLEGFLPVHVYYIGKYRTAYGKNEVTEIGMLLYSRLYEEALQTALAIMINQRVNTMPYVFILTLCLDNVVLVEKHADAMPLFLRVAQAYYAGEIAESLTEDEKAVFPMAYTVIALTEGLGKADRLAAVYASEPEFVFQHKARYLTDNGMFDILLDSIPKDIALTVFDNCIFVIESYIHCMKYKEAYDHIHYFLKEERSNDPILLSGLKVIQEKGEEPLISEARALHDRYQMYFDTLRDLEEVVKFRYAEDDCSYAETKKLANLTPEEFEKIIHEEDEGRVVSCELFAACEEAGPIFEQKRMFGMAIRCYRLPYCHNHNKRQNAENLARAFRGARNRRLARWFEEQYAEGRDET